MQHGTQSQKFFWLEKADQSVKSKIMFNTVLTNILPSNDAPHPEGYECESVILRTPRGFGEETPLVVSCPHAGVLIPENVLETLAVDPIEVLARGDRYTDWLTAGTPNYGGRQIISKITPTILNVGRSPASLDPNDIRGGAGSLVTEIDKYTANGKGQGIVAFKTLYGAKTLYKPGMEPDEAEIRSRIATYYQPFHDTLDAHINDVSEKHGYALVFDAHSAPAVGNPADMDAGEHRADVILSNNPNERGVSVDDVLLNDLAELAQQHGLSTRINHPYRGGFVTQTYGANGPKGSEGFIEAFQIEFNRGALGINEQTLELVDAAKFVSLQTFTNAMLAHISHYASMKAEASQG